MKTKYNHSSHCKYLLKLHFVFAVKYRKKLMKYTIDTDMKQIIFEIAHQLKQISTFIIYKKHKVELKKHFWKENTFWSDGYFVCSTGNASTETIRKYIETQG